MWLYARVSDYTISFPFGKACHLDGLSALVFPLFLLLSSLKTLLCDGSRVPSGICVMFCMFLCLVSGWVYVGSFSFAAWVTPIGR